MPDESPQPRRSLLAALDALALITIVVVSGYDVVAATPHAAAWVVVALVTAIGAFADMREVRASPDPLDLLRRQGVEWLALALAIFIVAFLGPQHTSVKVCLFVRLLVHMSRETLATRAGAALAGFFSEQAARLLVFSFLAVIAIGTLALTFPRATSDGQGASFLDALFTSVSATCVTGLIVRDTGSYFSSFGQGVILVLIQVGALGMMTISASAAVMFGRRLGLRSRSVLAEVLGQGDLQTMHRLVSYIVKMTFLIELAGALLLYLRFRADMPSGAAAYQAIFHAISAFANAGFSLNADSLVGYRADLVVNTVISALIVLGGFGFTVIAALTSRDSWRRTRRSRWASSSAHTRMVLIVSGGLLAFGAVAFYFLEYRNTLAGLPLGDKLFASGFASVSARTAGFNTVDLAQLGPAMLMLTLALMFIGGAPGGTAGGVKVTTVAVLTLAVRSYVLGRSEVEVFGRTIPKTVVYKAVAIVVISFGLLMLIFTALLATQDGLPFERLLFESVSAYGTVGLSMGLTDKLDAVGRVLIAVLMFIGRTGPLAMALLIASRGGRTAPYKLPHESVLVG
ncbi:MAG: TrkH family potassium uptake protein [Myxococcales bacterium]|nr:TrkH family potassium uptake protein [Myxococcales bacterium]